MTPRRAPRPPILRELRLDRHTVIEASAGTGKTFTLENLVVEILLSTDVTIDQLLVVTFTEKATNELRARMRAKLEELEALASADGAAAAPDDGWLIDESARAKMTQAARGFDAATITTIHAFCQRILRENAFASGRLFDERPVDGRDAFGRAVRDALRRGAASGTAEAPWIESALRAGHTVASVEELLWQCVQAHASLRPELDVASLAAAIASFPTDVVRSIEWPRELKSWGVHSNSLASITRRLLALADATDASRATGLLTEYLALLDPREVYGLVKQLGKVRFDRTGPAARACAAALELARWTPSFDGALAQVLLPGVLRAVAEGKRLAGVYDFDDMLGLVDEALRGPRGDALARAMRRRWRFALIDEFQDTDATQWSIFRRAFVERGPGEGRGGLFLVGDPKQSIYRFRGADLPTYLQARDAVASSGGHRVVLDASYRATQALVDALNTLFDPEAAEPLLSPATGYEAVRCGRPERALVDGDGAPVRPVQVLCMRELSPEALGAAIAEETKRAVDPARPWRLDGRPLEHHDVHVLTRTKQEGRVIGQALRAAGVPFAFFKEEGLFQTAEARDLRALLAAIEDPDDRACRLGAWLTPFFGLPLEHVERARDLPAGHPLVERLRHWKAIAEERDFDRLFESIIRDSGIVRREIFFGDGERSLTNTLHLVEVLLERTREGHTTLRDLGAELGGLIAKTRTPSKIDGDIQRLDGERRAVQIMTIHKAKGLEAALVFIAGGLTRSFGGARVRVYHERGERVASVGEPPPDADEVVHREEKEEDERLMYVALTRAKGRLVLPCIASEGSRKPVLGAYARVNRRVAELVASGHEAFELRDVAAEVQPSARGGAANDGPGWTPPRLARQDGEAAVDGALRARMREQRAGVTLTSYTKMHAARAAFAAAQVAVPDRERDGDPAPFGGSPDGVLAPARGSGIFLHEVLERVPLASFLDAADFAAWRTSPGVRALFDETIGVHRVRADQRDHAERLVWAAYTRPISLPTGERLDGIVRADRVAREMKFVYAAGAAARGKQTFVRGALDLAFEHAGRTYVVDWKSDRLSSYEPESLERRITEQYVEQVRLYTLATTNLLGAADAATYAARFGGLVYCFLRGLEAGHGVWSTRPSWREVEGWARELREVRP